MLKCQDSNMLMVTVKEIRPINLYVSKNRISCVNFTTIYKRTGGGEGMDARVKIFKKNGEWMHS